MGRQAQSGMHVDRVRSRHTAKSGEIREYESRLLRRSFRKPDGRVGKETLANLSALPEAAVDAIEAVLKGKTLIEAGAALSVRRSLAHGHVALVHAAARQLGLPALLGPDCRERDLAYALVISRVVAPRSTLATLAWWDDVTLGPDLGIADAHHDQVHAALDWLLGQQDRIEAALASRHQREGGTALLAAYLTRHLDRTLAPLTGTDERPHGLRGLLDHLATLTRATITVGDATFDKISDPTPVQRRAFDLIAAPIPLTITTD